MTTPYLGEIRMFGFNFAPHGYALCAGQLMAIQQNTALFSLLGTYYGGNGVTTFALPDLRSRAPIHVGMGPGLSGRVQGQIGGEEGHTLNLNEIPQHNHLVQVGGTPTTGVPDGTTVLAAPASAKLFRQGGSPSVSLSPSDIALTGNNQPHSNLQPYLVVNFSIALQGIFPSRN